VQSADALRGGRAVPLVTLGIPAEPERAPVRAVRVDRGAPGQAHGGVGIGVGERAPGVEGAFRAHLRHRQVVSAEAADGAARARDAAWPS